MRVQARSRQVGGELDSHEEVRLTCGPRRDQDRLEVSWTLTKKLDSLAGPGEIKTEVGGELDSLEEVRLICGSRRDQEEGGELDSHEEVTHLRVQARQRGGRWCWTLKIAQKRSRAGRWPEPGSASWTSFASVVSQQLRYGHCLCDSAPHSSRGSNCVVH